MSRQSPRVLPASLMSFMSVFLRSAAAATRLSVGPSVRLPLPLAARQPLRAFRAVVFAEGGKVAGTVKWCALLVAGSAQCVRHGFLAQNLFTVVWQPGRAAAL